MIDLKWLEVLHSHGDELSPVSQQSKSKSVDEKLNILLAIVFFFEVGWHCFTDLLLRIDSKFTASIALLIKSSLMKCGLAFVLRRSLQTGLNNLYWAVCKMVALTLYSAD